MSARASFIGDQSTIDVPKPGSKGLLGTKSKTARVSYARVCLSCGAVTPYISEAQLEKLRAFLAG